VRLFQLLYDRVHNVLLTRLSGVYTEEDIVVRDRLVARFVARNGLARGLMDYTAVTRVDIPMDVIVRRAQAPPILPGQTRVVVAPNEPAYSLNRVIVAHQYFSRKVEPLMVASLQHANYALGRSRFEFHPLEEDEQMRRERAIIAALATIDDGGRSESANNRRLSASWRQRMADAEAGSPMTALRRFSFITLSDLFNTVLRHSHLIDSQVRFLCPRCSLDATLAACEISVQHHTTYSCPACHTKLVNFAPRHGRPTDDVRGYDLGGFDVQTWADLRCHGVVVPKTER
jgi:predicted RNA-binding Zn-ribbon protein involved in translation (DUF1610 family)